MIHQTPKSFEEINKDSIEYLIKLRSMSRNHKVSERLPESVSNALRSIAYELSRKEMPFIEVEKQLKEALLSSFIDKRVFEVSQNICETLRVADDIVREIIKKFKNFTQQEVMVWIECFIMNYEVQKKICSIHRFNPLIFKHAFTVSML